MPYIDLAGLSRFASRQKDRLERDYAFLRDMQWLRTDKAGAVSLWPIGGTPLKPVVDFLFSETPPASGDKGPDNPSTITGVSEVKVTRCGKNLVPLRDSEYVSPTGVTFTPLGDGGYRIHGETNGVNTAHCSLNGGYLWPYKNGVTYRVNLFSSATNIRVIFQCFNSNGTIRMSRTANDGGYTYTNNVGDELLSVRLSVDKAAGEVDLVVYPQIELGSANSEFEKPVSTDYTIPLGNTYYGGTLDVASGVMTVTHGVKVLDGTESWSLTSSSTETVSNFQTTIVSLFGCTGVACSHYVLYSSGVTENYFTIYSDGRLRIGGLSATTYPDKDVFESWLAAQYANRTPVTVAYAMATPQTVQLTPTEILSLAQSDKYTPRLNTVYTDASAVQVGYVKSPIRDEYELQQAVIAQGGNV